MVKLKTILIGIGAVVAAVLGFILRGILSSGRGLGGVNPMGGVSGGVTHEADLELDGFEDSTSESEAAIEDIGDELEGADVASGELETETRNAGKAISGIRAIMARATHHRDNSGDTDDNNGG